MSVVDLVVRKRGAGGEPGCRRRVFRCNSNQPFCEAGHVFGHRVDGVFHSLGAGGLAIDFGRWPPAGSVLHRGLFCSNASPGTLGVFTCHDDCRCWVRALVTGNSTRALLLTPKYWCDFSYQLVFDMWPLLLARTRVEPRAGMV